MAFTSCKESDPAEGEHSKRPVVPVRDSVSYTIDGKSYAGRSTIDLRTGSQDANRKLIIYNNNPRSYSLTGNPDSMMYYQKHAVVANNANITFTFLRKYRKTKQGAPWLPGRNDVLKLFTVGKHALAEDFEWQNTQDGVAIDVAEGSSYNAYNGVETVVAAPGFQKNSSFEIISFTERKPGVYNLRARFTATILDAAGKQKKLENGYLELDFALMYNSYGN